MPRWSAAERGSRTQLDAADTAVQTSVASSSGDRGQEGAETPLKPRGRRWGSSAGYDTHSENPGAPPVAAVGDNAQHDGGSSQSAEDAGSAGQQPNQLFVSKALVEKNSAEAAAVTAAVAVARKNAKTAARFAGELFQPQALRLSHQGWGGQCRLLAWLRLPDRGSLVVQGHVRGVVAMGGITIQALTAPSMRRGVEAADIAYLQTCGRRLARADWSGGWVLDCQLVC
eukprot:TRINITY_DN65946_c0_g1_i2.p1 TRINITY_DN65946_c0_g1~~TRINITY_DN65946_c0_g1_i2.p1  ORF type:complete len:228 (+),score=32.95 TRINITY_DN65946_c0_g1_i2:78-761(+)